MIAGTCAKATLIESLRWWYQWMCCSSNKNGAESAEERIGILELLGNARWQCPSRVLLNISDAAESTT
jgi:hypothetical protein